MKLGYGLVVLLTTVVHSAGQTKQVDAGYAKVEQNKVSRCGSDFNNTHKCSAELQLDSSRSLDQISPSTNIGRDSQKATGPSQAAIVPPCAERRFTFGVRAAFSLPQNDLKLTTGKPANLAAGTYAEFRLGERHSVKPVGEYWYFTPGRQYREAPRRAQKIDTRVRAAVLGGEYSYRLAPLDRRFAFVGGLHLVRWSVDSIDEVTFTPGETQIASGTSHWIRLGESLGLNYQISRRLSVETRLVHSTYGYEHIPVNVAFIGFGWRF